MLKTKRLILRTAQDTDLEDMFQIYSDPLAMKYWSTAPHTDRAQTQKKITIQSKAAQERLVYFVIEYERRVIGQCGMHGQNEYGFILHPDFWRQGIITEASDAVIPYLFETCDIDRLTADADPLNDASVGALISLGFKETHRAKNTFCINGVWSDSVYFELLRAQAVTS